MIELPSSNTTNTLLMSVSGVGDGGQLPQSYAGAGSLEAIGKPRERASVLRARADMILGEVADAA